MSRILAFLRRNSWLLLVGAILEGLIGYQVVRNVPATYQAAAVVNVDASAAAAGGGRDAQLEDQLVRTAVEAMRTRPLLEQAATEAGLDATQAGLERKVAINLVRDTNILRIVAEDGDPARAAALANAVPHVFSVRMARVAAEDLARSKASLERLSQQQRAEADSAAKRVQDLQAVQPPEPAREADLANLRNQAALLEASYTATLRNYQDLLGSEQRLGRGMVEVLEAAVPPEAPARPNYALLALLAVIAGTALATLLALAREHLDDSLGDAERVRLRLNLPTLGTVSAAGADYELLAGRCRALIPDRLIPSAVITAASQAEQSSSIAVNLSSALARFGDQVLLVGVNASDSSATRNLFSDNGHASEQAGEDGYVVRTTEVPGLRVLMSDARDGESPLSLKARIEQLPGEWDTIVFDAPPVLERPDAAVLASYVEVALVVVDPRRSSARATARAVRNLNAVGAQILGVVLNAQPETVREADPSTVSAPQRRTRLARPRVPVRDSAP
jgi:polysaccharide biosynthesis transport protein